MNEDGKKFQEEWQLVHCLLQRALGRAQGLERMGDTRDLWGRLGGDGKDNLGLSLREWDLGEKEAELAC